MKRLRVPRPRQLLLLRGFRANVQDRSFPVIPVDSTGRRNTWVEPDFHLDGPCGNAQSDCHTGL
jgi:hypothetical protein